MRLVEWLEEETGREWSPEDLGGGFMGLTTVVDDCRVLVTYGDMPIDNETLVDDVPGEHFSVVFGGSFGFRVSDGQTLWMVRQVLSHFGSFIHYTIATDGGW